MANQDLKAKVMVILSFNTQSKRQPCRNNWAVVRVKNSLLTKFTREILVDLIHLQDDVIGNTSLSQEDVELAGHTTRNRVDSEPIEDGSRTSMLIKQTDLDSKLPTH